MVTKLADSDAIDEQCTSLDTMEQYLKDVKCHLIVRADHLDEKTVSLSTFIRDADPDGDEVIDEGFDPHSILLARPVYWRLVKRGAEQIYVSTFDATRQEISKRWGQDGLAYCNPVTGRAAVTLENFCRNPAPAEN
jgi:hypothetical protein